jgi:hypothetical protein
MFTNTMKRMKNRICDKQAENDIVALNFSSTQIFLVSFLKVSVVIAYENANDLSVVSVLHAMNVLSVSDKLI